MRGRWHYIVSSLLFTAFPVSAIAGIQISEVQFNPAGTDTGGEYVTIRNSGSASENLSGWQLYPDGIGYFVFGDTPLAGGAALTIRLRASGTNTATETFYNQSADGKAITSNMGNTSGSVALFNAADRSAGTIVDFVEWGKAGETWESAADTAGIWTKGSFVDVANATEGQALKRTGSGAGASAWIIGSASTPTPAETSENSSTSSGSTNSSSAVSSGSGNTSSEPATAAQSYRVQIATQSRVTIGSVAQFSGSLIAPSGDKITLNSTQYVWNFGDGSIANGMNVEHVFQYPGTYMISLTIPHDKQALSAYATVTASPANVRITEVFPGSEGWIEITNGSVDALHLSRWLLASAGKTFMFPAGTIIAPNAAVVFPVASTHLVMPSSAPSVSLQLSNGVLADTFETIAIVPSGMSAARAGDAIIFGVPTPGVVSAPPSPASSQVGRVSEQKSVVNTFTNVASAAVKIVGTTIERVSTTSTSSTVSSEQHSASQSANVLLGMKKEYAWLMLSVVGGLLLGAIVYRVRTRKLRAGARA